MLLNCVNIIIKLQLHIIIIILNIHRHYCTIITLWIHSIIILGFRFIRVKILQIYINSYNNKTRSFIYNSRRKY